MNFHSDSVDFVTDFCVNFWCGFLGPSVPLNKGQKINREIHSKIHDKIPTKFTHVVKNDVGKSILQEEGPDNPVSPTSKQLGFVLCYFTKFVGLHTQNYEMASFSQSVAIFNHSMDVLLSCIFVFGVAGPVADHQYVLHVSSGSQAPPTPTLLLFSDCEDSVGHLPR